MASLGGPTLKKKKKKKKTQGNLITRQNVRPTTSIPLHHRVSDNAVPLQVLLQQQLAVQGTPHWLPDLCTHFLQDSGLVQVRRRQEEGGSTPLTTSPISHLLTNVYSYDPVFRSLLY